MELKQFEDDWKKKGGEEVGLIVRKVCVSYEIERHEGQDLRR